MAVFDILLPTQNNQTLYQQIYNQIRDQIRDGKISDGMRLPSVRTLQVQLNISKTPIETAYQMLNAEGYVVSKPRSGLYAANPYIHSTPAPSAPKNDGIRETVHVKHPIGASSANPIDFDPTTVDNEFFPLRTWNNMLKTALEDHAGLIGKYGNAQGEYALRLVIADYLRNSRGVSCSPDQIVIGTGMAYSIGILARLITDIRQVAFEDPGYSLVRDQFVLNGWGVVPIPVEEKGISLDALDGSPVRAVYVTPSHQFPTGSIMPYPERERLLKWASVVNAFIIEDDYDGEFRYLGKPIPSLQSLDSRGNVIYIGTFSKTFTPALRMNYMVLPPRLAERLAAMPQEVLFAPSRIEQWAMQRFMEQGHWYRHLRRVRNLYRKKHQHLIELFQTYFGNQVEITGQNAGLHIQISVRQQRTSEELVQLAAEAGVKVYDFKKMSLKQAASEYPNLYLGFAGIPLSSMERGIQLLKAAWFPQA
jgi:GntR family transcriptional regulator / MocR family aminotransferase